jgi:Family of unknown function (DUF6152)
MRNTTHVARHAIILVSLLAGGTSLALAHHSYSAFEMAGVRVITGTIRKMDWTNPHTWIWIDVANEQGVVETWGIEGMSPNYLERRGWTRTTIKVGDRLSITFHPLKNGDKGGSFQSAQRPSGEVLGMTPPITEK